MKSFIFAMIIAALTITGGIILNNSINEVSRQLVVKCDEISEFILDDKIEDAADASKNLSEFVDKKKTALASLMNHDSIDEIELCVSELMGYTENKDAKESLVRCKKLKHLAQHLPSNYSVSLQNIL